MCQRVIRTNNTTPPFITTPNPNLPSDFDMGYHIIQNLENHQSTNVDHIYITVMAISVLLAIIVPLVMGVYYFQKCGRVDYISYKRQVFAVVFGFSAWIFWLWFLLSFSLLMWPEILAYYSNAVMTVITKYIDLEYLEFPQKISIDYFYYIFREKMFYIKNFYLGKDLFISSHEDLYFMKNRPVT